MAVTKEIYKGKLDVLHKQDYSKGTLLNVLVNAYEIGIGLHYPTKET